MAYIPFTNEQLIRANTVNLVEFLRLKGEKLERCGKEYRLVYTDSYGKHDSIMIHGSTWFDHKNQVGGGAIKFMQQFYGLSFPIAVQTLLGKECEQPVHKQSDDITEKEKAEFRLPPENKTMYRVFAYLTKQRFIAGSVVSHFAHAHTLYEDAQHHNAVFVGLNESGEPKQASRRSTTSFGISFKGTCEGSDTKYSFAHFGESDKLFVFEAPIDMLSFITLYPNEWQKHSYIALNGVYEHALVQALESRKQLQQVVLCLDNDEGGRDGAERLRDILHDKGYDRVSIVSPCHKDWNEDLKALNGQQALPGVPSRRKQVYFDKVRQMQYLNCRTDKLTSQLRYAYKNSQYRYLAEYALAGSAFFMRVKDEKSGFVALQNRLIKSYRGYSDKGKLAVKLHELSQRFKLAIADVKRPGRTDEQSVETAKKLYDLADQALRVSTEMELMQPIQELTETEEEELDEDEDLGMSMGYG